MFQEHLAELMLAVHEQPQPVIAAVHGAAVGGGLALALACDLRVATHDAFFASQFIRVGLSSCDVGTSYVLPRIVGPTHAGELMLTGRRFSAEEADRMGMLPRGTSRRRARLAGGGQQRVRRVHDEDRLGNVDAPACATPSSSRTARRCSARSPAT